MSKILLIAILTVLGVIYEDGMKLGWDPPTTDINGDPETVVSAEVGIFLPGSEATIRSVKDVSPTGTGWDITPLVENIPDGPYELKAKVFDSAGNESIWSEPFQLTVDSTAPAQVAVVYKEGMQLKWDPVTVDVNGGPETVVSAEVGIFMPGVTSAINTVADIDPAGAGWDISSLTANVADGAYEIKVRIYDQAGNGSEWSEPLQLVIDTVPPAKPTGLRLFK